MRLGDNGAVYEADRRAARLRAAKAAAKAPPRSRNGYPAVHTSARRTRDSFSPPDRITLYRISAARHGGVARCAVCGRPVRLSGPPGLDRMVAGHVVAWRDGGLPVLENGRAECSGCSWREGRYRLGLASTAAAQRRKAIGAPAPREPADDERPAEWLVELLERYR